MRITAQGWLVYELTRDKAALGGITALGLLPFVVLAPFGGVVADRKDRRKLMFLTQAVAVLVNVAVGIDVLLGTVEVWHVAATAVLVGAARAVEIPVRQALVQDLVGSEDRSNAIGLNAAAFQLARVVGPSIGGLVLWLAGTGPCFLVVAACAGFNLGVLPTLALETAPSRPSAGGTWRQLAEGFRYVRDHRRTRTLLLLVFVSFVCVWPYQAFLPAIADEVLGVEEAGYGLLVAVTGVGALLGALWVAGRASTIPATRRVVFGLVWAGALCVAGIGAATHVATTLPGLLVAGFCQVAFVATANTMVQASAPDELRGRVMGIWTFVFGASYPAGSFAMGHAAERFGTLPTFAGGAALALLLTLAIRSRMPPREMPEPPPAQPMLPEASPPGD
jgi:MFS family permease